MSWQPEVFIGELRPWPDSVLVTKGASDERKRYVPEETCKLESSHGWTDAYVSHRWTVELDCHTIDDWGERELPDYCPYCGRKVVDE